ncbi:zinc-dependent alcohol dehydrogenase [Runella sp.]|uniref:zinc-dependent alcohol dehydrogenase n=1 Tax=Runella sp. TaxID=1960881 RepID=UPI003D10EFCF
MRAAFLTKPKEIQLSTIAVPEPRAGEVRVKLKMIGVCGSDVHLFLGHRQLPSPTVIGHEGLGIIDKLGEGVTGRILGQRVVIEPNTPCYKCTYCLKNRGNICPNKRILGLNEPGCFAEYVIVPADFCWPLPETISDNDAVTIEPMAVSVHALLSSNAKPGDTIAVIGLGAIGLLLTHLALSLGYKVFVTEISQTKINLAKEMGAVALYPVGDTQTQADFLNAIWEQNQVAAVFECAGTSHTASLATAAAPRGSEIVLVGLSAKPATFTPLKIAREGIHIIPSIIYDHPLDFKRTIQLIAAGIVRPSFIISRFMPLYQLQTALEFAAAGEDSKIIILP